MTPDRIRLAIVDDHPALRDGTAMLLEQQADLEVMGSVATLAEARELLAGPTPPQVLVLDIRLAEERGLDLLVELTGDRADQPAVVIWTGFDMPQYAAYALKAGASGFVLKTAPLSELVDAIRIAAAGGVHFDRTWVASDQLALSPREREVLIHIVDGRSNDEIAVAMGVTSRAIEAHLTRLYQRYDIGSRTELATRAIRESWLDLPAQGACAVNGGSHE